MLGYQATTWISQANQLRQGAKPRQKDATLFHFISGFGGRRSSALPRAPAETKFAGRAPRGIHLGGGPSHGRLSVGGFMLDKPNIDRAAGLDAEILKRTWPAPVVPRPGRSSRPRVILPIDGATRVPSHDIPTAADERKHGSFARRNNGDLSQFFNGTRWSPMRHASTPEPAVRRSFRSSRSPTNSKNLQRKIWWVCTGSNCGPAD